jgi:hypothetical protein
MTAEIDLCNRALSRLGTRATIAALSENSTEARTCSIWYEATRDAMLRAHDWNFARRQVALADLGTPPTGWDYRYALPSDCLRFLRFAISTLVIPSPAFEVAGTASARVLYTYEAEAEAIYTARVEDPTLFDAGFATALVDQLAAHIAFPIVQKTDVAVRLAQMARQSFAEAAALDGNERQTLGRGGGWADWDADAITARG